MKRFENILYVSPAELESGSTLIRAARFAKREDARLTLFDAVPDVSRRLRIGRLGIPEEKFLELLMTDRRESLATAAEKVRRSLRVEAEPKVTAGKLFIEVIREVVRGEYDLVMKPAGGGARRPLLGSNDLQLLRKCPCPVWIMKGRKPRRPYKVTAAIDVTDEADRNLSAKILEVAALLAGEIEGELHVVHAWDLGLAESLLNRTQLSREELAQLHEESKAEHRAEIQALLGVCEALPSTTEVHLLEGDAADEVVEFAAQQKTAVLVMGTLARTGVAGLLIGNTAERVLGRVSCSVLAVKPDGFQTPVEVNDRAS